MRQSNQGGQSLVEFVILAPIFFIILSGVMTIFYLQNRHFVDLESKISLGLSQFLFDKEERQFAKWSQWEFENKKSLKEILNYSVNPSLAFDGASDKKENIFMDKSLIFVSDNTSCSSKNTISILAKSNGQFQMSSCADKNGYERTGFSFEKVLNSFPLSIWKSSGESPFYPYPELSWKHRAELASKSAREFMLSPKGISFSKRNASLEFPVDISNFNKKCFMEPFDPQCSLSPYLGKINRAAQDGANNQLFACHAEMLLTCTQSATLMPVCVAEGLEEIKLSTQIGRAARNCPIVNKEIEAYFHFVKSYGLANSIENTSTEFKMRKNLL